VSSLSPQTRARMTTALRVQRCAPVSITRDNGHNTTSNNQQPSQRPVHKAGPGHPRVEW